MMPRLCIAVHDVAPTTWPQCAAILDMLDRLDCRAVTLLVVPDYHGRGHVASAPNLVGAIHHCVERGAEVALHGYLHRDDEPSPRDCVNWLRRCVLTDGEGEFSSLSATAAALRIEQGRKELADLGWCVRGFVAPAWLASRGTWQALRNSPLRYTATHGALVALDGMRRLPAPALSASVRTGWRRCLSRGWLRAANLATKSHPLLRIALHPDDALHAGTMRDWQWLIANLLERRTAVTKSQAIGCP